MSLYYKVNDDNNLVCDTRKTQIMIDSRNHVNPLDTTVKNSTTHFDNLQVQVEPIYDVVRMEILYYNLRFYEVASAYTNPYVNLYLSDYGKIVNNYDGVQSTFNANQAKLDRPFAILPLETSISYPVGYSPGVSPFNITDKLNYEQFPPNTAVGYSSTNKIPGSFKMVTDYNTPIDRISRINVQLRDFQGRFLSETSNRTDNTQKITSKI